METDRGPEVVHDVLHHGARLLVQEVVAHVGEPQQDRDRVEEDELCFGGVCVEMECDMLGETGFRE